MQELFNVANGNAPLSEEDLNAMERALVANFQAMMTILRIGSFDPQTAQTPERMARMYVREVFAGRYTEKPTLAVFPNTLKLDELYISGPLTLRSACSHHFVPIVGQCWVGILPGESLIGLSKIGRLVNWIAARPQIQEELTVQIADELEAAIKPRGIAVVIKAAHMCMTWRGVREPDSARMTTSVMRGALHDDATLRAEFFSLAQLK